MINAASHHMVSVINRTWSVASLFLFRERLAATVTLHEEKVKEIKLFVAGGAVELTWINLSSLSLFRVMLLLEKRSPC